MNTTIVRILSLTEVTMESESTTGVSLTIALGMNQLRWLFQSKVPVNNEKDFQVDNVTFLIPLSSFGRTLNFGQFDSAGRKDHRRCQDHHFRFQFISV